ncbi:MAG: hypothetical protein KAS66_13220 [Candidatus Omnitrophica bacterium]|nr:hypothetical protein [Candidatus Omnitrophota bacterium]
MQHFIEVYKKGARGKRRHLIRIDLRDFIFRAFYIKETQLTISGKVYYAVNGEEFILKKK